MDSQRRIFPKHNRLHYLDIMAINFILQLYMNDIYSCPTVIYKYVLRYFETYIFSLCKAVCMIDDLFRCCVHLSLLEIQCCPPKEKLDLTLHQHGHVSCELSNGK